MSYSEKLELPRKGLIRQEIITIEEKDGQIVKINVYSREKEVESKEFSY